MKSTLSIFFCAGAALFGQQVADPNFNGKVTAPAYAQGGPRILIDAAHHNVHTADGGYKAFADLISSDGYLIHSNTAPFRAAVLAGHRILVIANPRGAGDDAPMPARTKPAFTQQECEAVRDWVRGGGSMLLVSDHYPIGDATQVLATAFGVTMRKGVTQDPAHTDASLGGPSVLVYTREDRLLAEHPITAGRNSSERVNRVVAFTGQSLTGPPEAFSFLRLSGTAVDIARPSGTRTSAAGHSQGLAFEFGKGRVVVLGEAAMLSAQVAGPRRRPMGMNAPGVDNRQLALNIMRWLSRLL